MPSADKQIACLAWGSLVWDTRNLPIRGEWHTDGPLLPIEFARESSRDRITLVIVEDVAPVKTLWAPLEVASLAQAIAALADREGSSSRYIGRWPVQQDEAYPQSAVIGDWASERGIDGVVWTALPCGMKEKRGELPSLAELRSYLSKLDDSSRAEAAKYIFEAPAQIQTSYRKRLEQALSEWRT